MIGHGEFRPHPCPKCDGRGETPVRTEVDPVTGVWDADWVVCARCGGDGVGKR